MEEYRALAVAAVEALQAANQPKWTEVASVVVAGVVGIVQCGLIAWGIWIMKGSNKSRDITLKTLELQSKALERLLERTA